MRLQLDVTRYDHVPCAMCGVAYSVLRGRVADTEEWTGTFVVALHSHAAPAERTPIEQSPVTRTAHMVVSLAVYPDAGVSFMGMPARIDATEDAQLVAWESWADSPLRGEVAPAERLEPDDVRGSVDAAVFARVAGAVSDLPAVATYLGF